MSKATPLNAGLRASAVLHYIPEVIDAATGRTVHRYARRKNLILDQGLDAVALSNWPAHIERAAVGTGTTPTRRDSGAITFSRSGTTVSASAAFFEAADVGRLLKFDTGEEMRVTAYSDTQTVTVDTSGTLAAAEGTVWYVNQTGLVAEVKRTGSYVTGASNNSTTLAGSTVTHKRTFLFTAESGGVTYYEIGWSNTATAGNNLFGRDTITGGVGLVAGQQLKVTVELAITYSPTSPVAADTALDTIWSGATGNAQLEGFSVANITSTGATDTSNYGTALEPGGVRQSGLSTSSAALAAPVLGGGVNLTVGLAKDAPADSYVSLSFTRTYTTTFATSESNSASFRSVVLGKPFNTTTLSPVLRVLMGAVQAKTSDETLTLVWRLTWGRTLTN